ncbi:MAG: UDP-N-acetylglucosamine 2-epimerase (non-hydrolyzing) [Burkholderiaceae bacterium]|nr:UDP-N-acetylglucosamine 2-epimerase (non-hydrolyzing) [Burkholderiaceae bacterium]
MTTNPARRIRLGGLAKELLWRCAFVFGTRPEAIKIAPVVRALRSRGLRPYLISTGQQLDLVRQTRDALAMEVDVDLGLMRADQPPATFLGLCLTGLPQVLASRRPTAVFVQGDTTSALAGALCAHYLKIPLIHIEAGLRTNDLANPFPEEAHRQLIARIADVHLCPTPGDREALAAEGIDPDRIAVVGNTVIDLLRERNPSSSAQTGGSSVLVTTHRRENFDGPLLAIVAAVRRLATLHREVEFFVPVHPNPRVAPVVREGLSSQANVRLCEPLAYPDFIERLACCRLVITDSGGVQEEAAYLGKPVVIVRKCTERRLGVAIGSAFLAGGNADDIVRLGEELLQDSTRYRAASQPRRLYGDGFAADRIVRLLSGEPIDEFVPETEPSDCVLVTST